MDTQVLAGTGSTCTAAQSNLSSLTLSEANLRCTNAGYAGVCGTGSLTYVGACTWDANQHYYYRSGYRSFYCKECSVSNPCPN